MGEEAKTMYTYVSKCKNDKIQKNVDSSYQNVILSAISYI
jgi:hypothetical protein